MTTESDGPRPESVPSALRPGVNRWPLAIAAAPWTWFLIRDLDPRLDLIAIGLPLIVLAALALATTACIILRDRRMLLAIGSIAIFGMASVVWPQRSISLPEPTSSRLILSANVAANNRDGLAIADRLIAVSADVMVVAEAAPVIGAATSTPVIGAATTAGLCPTSPT